MEKLVVNIWLDKNRDHFYFLDLGGDENCGGSLRLWISEHLLTRGENGRYVIQFPVAGAQITRTTSNHLVMRPHPDYRVENVFIRDREKRTVGELEVLYPCEAESFSYEINSQLGGIPGSSKALLVNVPLNSLLYVFWEVAESPLGSERGIRTCDQEGEVNHLNEASRERASDSDRAGILS